MSVEHMVNTQQKAAIIVNIKHVVSKSQTYEQISILLLIPSSLKQNRKTYLSLLIVILLCRA